MQTYQITVANMFDPSDLTDTLVVTAVSLKAAVDIALNADVLSHPTDNYPRKIVRLS